MKNAQTKQYVISDTYNPIIEAAKPVLVLANAMNNTTTRLSVDDILFKFTHMIEQFESEAESMGAPYEMVRAAQYCLCTFVDESAVRSEWANEDWSQKSLLVSFFDETWGGERFFEITENAKLSPDKNLYLLEFVYLCLQFGYKGKYQVVNNGDHKIEKVKSELLSIINGHRPDAFAELLSNHKESPDEEKDERRWHIPLWVIGAFICLSLAAFYILFRWLLGNSIDQTSMQINSLSLPQNASYEVVEEYNVETQRLAPVLSNEIEQGFVEVRDYPDRSVVIILGDGLFESGSETVQDRYFPILATVGQAIDEVNGKVVVTGFTDDTPISSISFPSNWHLSQARADEVKNILLQYMSDEEVVRSEGRGSTNPAVPNTTPENKAKNRRVEITVYSVSNSHLTAPDQRITNASITPRQNSDEQSNDFTEQGSADEATVLNTPADNSPAPELSRQASRVDGNSDIDATESNDNP